MDLDGSTLTHDGKVPGALALLIQRNPHVHWIMVTGRSFAGAIATAFGSLLPKDSFHVFDGGAMIATLHGKIMYRRALPKLDVIKLSASLYLHPWEYVFGSHGTDPGFVCCRDPCTKLPPSVRSTENLSTFLCWVFAEGVQKLSVQGMDTAGIPDQINHYSNGKIIDFLPPEVNKASGVQHILSLLSVIPEDTAFVFDDKNDLPVIGSSALRGMYRIKVGDKLPTVAAHATVRDATVVASALRDWLSFGQRDRLRGLVAQPIP
jgi:hydroxymethylpyrimidine pyrophosphatase-like HAD family hydrolase